MLRFHRAPPGTFCCIPGYGCPRLPPTWLLCNTPPGAWVTRRPLAYPPAPLLKAGSLPCAAAFLAKAACGCLPPGFPKTQSSSTTIPSSLPHGCSKIPPWSSTSCVVPKTQPYWPSGHPLWPKCIHSNGWFQPYENDSHDSYFPTKTPHMMANSHAIQHQSRAC